MRILPRSRRGTWLLAAAAWLTACAGLWYALPVVPRAFMQLPKDCNLLSFGPDGKTAVVCRSSRFLDSQAEFDGENVARDESQAREPYERYELLQVPYGRVIAPIADGFEYRLVGYSRDAATWLFQRTDDRTPRFLKVDLAPLRIEPPTDVPPDADRAAADSLSPGGRYCVLSPPESSRASVLWDLSANRTIALPNAVRLPIAFSADDRLLIGVTTGRRNCLHVIDLHTMALRHTLVGPDFGFDGSGQVQTVRVSPDGSGVCVDFYRWLTKGADDRWTWRLATGEVESRELVYGDVTSIPYAYIEVAPYVRNGEQGTGAYPVFSAAEANALPQTRFPALACSPNGRTVLVPVEEPAVEATEQWIRDRGLPWPFSAGGYRLSARLYDANNGRQLCRIPAAWPADEPRDSKALKFRFQWSPDGRRLAVMNPTDRTNTWQIWDIPPGKPLPTLAVWAALLTLPIAWLARRRVRKLRAVAV